MARGSFELRLHTRIAVALAVVVLGAGGAGCGGGGGQGASRAQPPQGGDLSNPQGPDPCKGIKPGVAADGVNDDQGGSVPGTDPCNGPGT